MYLVVALQVPERLRCPHDSYLQGFKDGIGSRPSIPLDSGTMGRLSERTSQAVKTTMRYWISQGQTNRPLLIPDLLRQLNDSRNELTGISSNEYCYGFEVNEVLRVDLNAPPTNLPAKRLELHQEAADALTFANLPMKQRYDASTFPWNFPYACTKGTPSQA
jgi:hypothetical protein